MSQVVLDSGIFIASVYPETLSEKAKALLKQLQNDGVEIHAPTLLHYELTAVARKAVHQKRVTVKDGRRARDILLSYPVILHFDSKLLKRGYELAETHNRPTAYDSQYLALAEYLDCDFWTADKRLFNAVNHHFPHIYWLGNK